MRKNGLENLGWTISVIGAVLATFTGYYFSNGNILFLFFLIGIVFLIGGCASIIVGFHLREKHRGL